MDGIVQWKNQLLQHVNQAQQWFQRMSSTPLYTTIGVVSLSTIAIFSIRWLKPRKSNTIILAGLSGSGKTVLFHQLRDGSSHQGTVTSTDTNEATFVLQTDPFWKGKRRLIHLVDVPGQSHLRPKLNKYLPQAAGLIFLVDGLEFLRHCPAIAEYLMDILTNATVVKRKIPVLIVCNKTDKVTAHTKEFIQKLLEREIQKLRASGTAMSEADIANEYTLGVTGEAFTFSQCSNIVTVEEASGLVGEISQVEQFITKHLKP
ncbi:hypothetical protein PVL29_022639 [Vitis rotundifolia]|uniref:Signal recognition particle receptor subunit beta n=1 Tax=Vitis rotundifolia TaxID=103349 RepID=A0AA39DB93_VITRO|nr:hypothetical protein PVL29_022639 [Vitis rotundifolia]